MEDGKVFVLVHRVTFGNAKDSFRTVALKCEEAPKNACGTMQTFLVVLGRMSSTVRSFDPGPLLRGEVIRRLRPSMERKKRITERYR